MTKKNETAEQEFIKNVLREIRFPLVKQDIRQELKDHIEDKKDDWMFREEMTEEEAWRNPLKKWESRRRSGSP